MPRGRNSPRSTRPDHRAGVRGRAHPRRRRARRDGGHAGGARGHYRGPSRGAARRRSWRRRSPPAKNHLPGRRRHRGVDALGQGVPDGRTRRKRKFWACTSKGHSSARRAAACIRPSGLCRLRSIYSQNFWTPHGGAARILTLAPELARRARTCRARRAPRECVVSLGHTDASYAASDGRHRARRASRRARLQRHAPVRASRDRRDRRGVDFAATSPPN